MAQKLKPCMTESRRHTWEFVRNVILKKQGLTFIELSEKGKYRCVTCGQMKYGMARIKRD